MIDNALLKRKILDSIYNNNNNNYVIEEVVNVFDIVGGSQPPKSQFISEEKDGYVRLYQTRDYGERPVPVYVKKNSVSKFTKKGDILLARYGGSLGKVFIAEEGAYNVALAKVIIKDPKRFYDKFVYYYFLSSKYQNFTKTLTKMAQAGFNKNDLSNLTIIVPSFEEQHKIANKIEELFELIDKKEKNDNEKEKLKTLLKEKILDSAIRGQLVEQNELEKNSLEYIKNIQKIKENFVLKKELKRDSKINYNKPETVLPKGWNWVRLGDLGIYKKGPFGSSLTKDMFVADGPNSYKVYEQKNAIQKDWKLGNYFITKEKYDSMKSFTVKPNDIIVSCAGTIGEIYVIPQKARVGIINQALMKITLFDNSIMDFFIMYFDHVLKYESRKKGKGTAICNIPPFDVLKNIYIPLPPIEEQHRIMNKIKKCFELIEQL